MNRLFVMLTAAAIAGEVAEASAKDFQVPDQDQANILVICDLAAQSPAIAREVRANIAAFCMTWQKRIEAASTSSQVPPPAPKEDGK